jgi:hypothetical protein
MTFTFSDYIRCTGYTIVLALLVIFFSDAQPRVEAVLIGLAAAVSALTVNVSVLRREITRLASTRQLPH